MVRRVEILAWLVVVLGCATRAGAEEPLVVSVWPGDGRPPGDPGARGEEHFREPWSEDSKGIRWLTAVSKPTLTVYRPSREVDTGAAVVICPGGGYWNLAWDLEGEEVAAWLNSLGVTGIILKYRVPRRPGQPEPQPAPGPPLDAQRAIRVVRSHAREWGIDPERIGMVGFSAGGHLTMLTALNGAERLYEPIDEVDRLSGRPNFAIVVYPGYLVPKGRMTLAPGLVVREGTPPTFFAHAADDHEASALNSLLMADALLRAGVPTELHLYATGDHGFGVRRDRGPCSAWTDACAAWLRKLDMLTPR
jgi:acetyl esterase/lipase